MSAEADAASMCHQPVLIMCSYMLCTYEVGLVHHNTFGFLVWCTLQLVVDDFVHPCGAAHWWLPVCCPHYLQRHCLLLAVCTPTTDVMCLHWL